MDAHEALRIVSLEPGVEYRITNLRAGESGRFWIEVEAISTAQQVEQPALVERPRLSVVAQQPVEDDGADALEREHAASEPQQDDKHT